MREIPIQAIQKYIPGQVWIASVETEAINGAWTKRRPYLILAANNRRLILLKMTHGGVYSSNWIYSFKMGDEVDNIILDCPVTVDIDKINGLTYKYSFNAEMFREIHARFMSAFLSQSLPDVLRNEKYIEDVNYIIDNHEDKLQSYSIYTAQFVDADDDEDIEETEVVEEVAEPEEEDEDEEESVVSETTSTRINDLYEKITSTPVMEQISSKEQETIPDAKFEDPPTTEVVDDLPRFRNGPIKKPTTKDVILIDPSKMHETKNTDIFKFCESLGIKNSNTDLRIMVQRKEVSIEHDRYKVALKCNLQAANYKKQIYEDWLKFGGPMTAKIWGISVSRVSQIKNEVLK